MTEPVRKKSWPPAARAAAVLAMGLSALFGAALATRWGQLLPYGFGCFGAGEAQTVGWPAIGKDALLFAGGLLIAVSGRRHGKRRSVPTVFDML